MGGGGWGGRSRVLWSRSGAHGYRLFYEAEDNAVECVFATCMGCILGFCLLGVDNPSIQKPINAQSYNNRTFSLPPQGAPCP